VPEQTLNNNKSVIYARVSSKAQEREGYSIPAQLYILSREKLELLIFLIEKNICSRFKRS